MAIVNRQSERATNEEKNMDVFEESCILLFRLRLSHQCVPALSLSSSPRLVLCSCPITS